jgi:hypothetical protein
MAAAAAAAAAAASSAALAGGGGGENVKVAVRCRPFNRREKDLEATCIVEVRDGRTIELKHPTDASREPSIFTFDHAYFWDSRQEDLYADLGKPILDKAISGFNGTIFAYGQTGSGKTFSMMGGEDEGSEGIIPRLNRSMFEELQRIHSEVDKAGEGEEEPETYESLVSVSYLEIYNEVIKDLLNPSDRRLEVREHPKLGIYVKDLATLVVEEPGTVAQLIEQGNKVRKVAATKMNDRSSRSHSCFIIKIEQRRVVKTHGSDGSVTTRTTTVNAKLNLVDLAGSERAEKTGATGARLMEGAAINKSLTTLGNVINALASTDGKKRHVPYRDSKLTRLLQESLGGNSMTLMIAAVSPASDNFDESLSTLRYADRAKQIKNTAKRNEDVNQAIIRELRQEIEDLRKQLMAQQASMARNAGGTPEDTARVSELEDTISALEHAKLQSWERQQELSRLYEEERKKNLANETKVMSVMQTLKEDNMETLRRLKELDTDEAKLTKKFRKLRETHKVSRVELAEQMTEWQRLHELDGGREDGPNAEGIARCLERVEALHGQVEAEQQELLAIKESIKNVEEERETVRAEAAAQRRLLEEDAELRKAIAEEERKRVTAEAQAELHARLEEERAKLQREAERERQELLAKYHSSAGGSVDSGEMEKLQLELLEARRERDVARLNNRSLRAERDAEIAQVKADSDAELHKHRVQELRMLRSVMEGYEDERGHLRQQITELSSLLRQAAADITHLQTENEKLKGQLILARAWEPV